MARASIDRFFAAAPSTAYASKEDPAMDTLRSDSRMQPLTGRFSRRAALRRAAGGGIAACLGAAGLDRTGATVQAATLVSAAHPGPTSALHGHLVVGDGPIYLSHLPFFSFDPARHPHNVQVILEATFTPAALYADDRKRTGETLYTVAPEPFHMNDLLSPDSDRPPLRAFTANVYRGHFERGGTDLGAVSVDVANVVYAKEFQRDAEPPAHLVYVLFGTGSELFLAHVITAPPDFDQVLPVRITGHAFTDDALRQGVRIAVPERANDPKHRLKAGERVVGEAEGTGAGTPEPFDLQLDVATELYFEEGELASPPSFDPTPEEIAAGMP